MGKSLTIATQRNYSGNGFQREHEGSRKIIRDRHSSATCTGGSSSFHIQDALADEHATCAVGSQLLLMITPLSPPLTSPPTWTLRALRIIRSGPPLKSPSTQNSSPVNLVVEPGGTLACGAGTLGTWLNLPPRTLNPTSPMTASLTISPSWNRPFPGSSPDATFTTARVTWPAATDEAATVVAPATEAAVPLVAPIAPAI